MAPDPTKKKRSIHQEKSNHKSEESGSGNPENTRVKNFVLAREQKKSRAKTKKNLAPRFAEPYSTKLTNDSLVCYKILIVDIKEAPA
ncbi:hypothetical protein PGF_00015270 [Porphyromonas gingivalis 381]|nr:hypothetical protein PGF_00015270 [Porphyromonas gingivalis 381]